MFPQVVGLLSTLLLFLQGEAMDNSQHRLKNLLLQSPFDVLERNRANKEAFERKIIDDNLNNSKGIHNQIVKLDGLYDKFAKANPIFLFSECYGQDCIFRRTVDVGYREQYENEVVQALQKFVVSHMKSQVTCTSFGSEYAFSELLIINKLLQQCPTALVTLNIIDCMVEYDSFVKAVDGLKNQSRQIVSNQKPLMFTDSYIKKIKKNEKLDSPIADIKAGLTYTCYVTRKRYQQLLEYVKSNFPQSQLNIYVHNNVESYLSYLEKHNLAHADVIMAVDIQESNDLLPSGIYAYNDLCTITIKKNPHAISNILLYLDNSFRIRSLLGIDPGDGLTKKIDINGKDYYSREIILKKQVT